jgi:hypothetical protein
MQSRRTNEIGIQWLWARSDLTCNGSCAAPWKLVLAGAVIGMVGAAALARLFFGGAVRS